MTRMRRFERVAAWVAGVSAALGFLTSAGCAVLPSAPIGLVGFLHPLLLLVGFCCGLFTVQRGREIDEERWKVVEDPQLTSGEREWAHKNAERRRRFAATAFIAAPIMLGYWMAYQVEGEGRDLGAQLLPATGFVGSVIGLLLSRFVRPL